MSWTATYDPTTDIGAVRQLVFDTDLSIIPTGPNTPVRRSWTVVFADIEVQSAINRYSNDYPAPAYIYYAAAELCDSMATNRAWLAAAQKSGDYERDTKLTPKGLQDQAKIYRDLANNLPAEMITDVAWSDPNYARILYNRFVAGL